MRFTFIGQEAKLPKFEEDKKSPIVKYGSDNKYPNELIELLGKSGKHNALITGKVHYITGGGFKIADGEAKQRVEARAKLLSINPKEDADEILNKCVFDLELFGGFAIQMNLSNDGQNQYWSHVDFSKLRVSSDGEKFYYHDDWAKFGSKPSKALDDPETKVLPIYSKDEPKDGAIYYCYDYRPSYEFYPLPEYIASIPYIEIDYRIANFHLNNIKNGMSAGSMVTFFNGEPSEDQMREVERRFNEKFAGDKNAGGIVFHFADKNSEGSKVESLLPNNFDKLWQELNDTVQQELFIGHKIPNPMLFGVRVEGTLGGRNELIDSFELFKTNYVQPKQKKVEEVFNYILGTSLIEIEEIPAIKPQLSENALQSILTPNELRELAGYDPITEEEESTDGLAAKLGSISPLVATKVLETMTTDEIRSIVGLESTGGKPIVKETTTTLKNFSQDDKDLFYFEKIGKVYDGEVLGEREMLLDDDYQPILKEAAFRLSFQLDLDEIDKQVIDLLEDDPQRTPKELAEAVGESEAEMKERLKNLEEQGAIKKGVTTNDIGEEYETYEPSDEAKEEQPEKKIITVYKYAERPDAPPAKTGSRPFCQRMMQLSNAGHRYTREEINQISALAGRDVWTRRGGWYNHPTQGKRPFCRHYWVQSVIAV